MRIAIKLGQTQKECRLPINYNYHLTSLIYEILSRSSKDYSEFLHDEGYRYDESKKFKLFTYSQLRFSNMEVKRDTIISTSEEVKLFVSSPVDEFVEHLADGLLQKGDVEIAGANFRTKTVEVMESPEFIEGKQAKFLCLSPIVSSTMKEKGGELHTYYYRYDDPGLADNLKENLKKKYCLVHGNELKEKDIKFEFSFDQDYVKKRDGKVTKLIDFKGTKIKGIFAPFEVRASPELVEIGYQAGLGGKGSMGFGMVEVVDN